MLWIVKELNAKKVVGDEWKINKKKQKKLLKLYDIIKNKRQ